MSEALDAAAAGRVQDPTLADEEGRVDPRVARIAGLHARAREEVLVAVVGPACGLERGVLIPFLHAVESGCGDIGSEARRVAAGETPVSWPDDFDYEIALVRAKESGGGRTWRADDPRRHGLNPVALSEDLTEREWDVLVHLSHRRTEQEIARRLGISRGTVRSHKARIRRKLHVSPDMRLSDFVRTNFRDLVNRLPADITK